MTRHEKAKLGATEPGTDPALPTGNQGTSDNTAAAPGLAEPSNVVTMLSLDRFFSFVNAPASDFPQIPRPNAQAKAQLLHDYCVSSGKRVAESVHNLFAIAEHYASDEPGELENPEVINGIPPYFKDLTSKQKADYCYNQVTESLALEALPVTVDSLIATRRTQPNDPVSSFAGRFVVRVTGYVTRTIAFLAVLYLGYLVWNNTVSDELQIPPNNQTLEYITWVAFGCVGALVHLLNHALTTTRLKTFETSEERKVWPRLLLGGMFGFVLPWLLTNPGGLIGAESVAGGTVAAFFGGYSVRFAIGLLERVLSAFLPETTR